MRLSALTLSFATVAAATIAVMAFPTAGQAQGWDPNYPICMDVYGRGGGYRECAFTSIPQCQATASGRSAECVVNPYYAGDIVDAPPRHGRRHRRHHHPS
jgi:hypothetical protein